MWYDTCVFLPAHIRTLVEMAGPERVMLGSDYPFDMGDPDPLGTLERAGLDAAATHAIGGETARSFFRLTL
jgi:aminocarboxymuconate-semialdehyde decarboxylase